VKAQKRIATSTSPSQVRKQQKEDEI